MAQPPPPGGFPPVMAGASPRPPTLPPGWTEHRGPQGEVYFFHAASGQSTYNRPSAPMYAGPPPPIPTPAADAASTAPPAKPRKEKPAAKDPIPGAEGWLRVTTTHGNVFFTHVATKRSEWSVPEEIKEAVQEMEREEKERKAKEAREKAEAEREKKEREERERKDREEEEERRRAERKAALEKARLEQERRLKELADLGKRKRGEQIDEADANGNEQESGIDADELLAGPASPKRAKTDVEDQERDETEDDEAAWQRQMAVEMAAEAEAASDEDKDEPSAPPHAAPAAAAPAQPIYSGPPPSIPPPPPGGYKYPPPPLASAAPPPPPNLSIEEASLLFRRMLTSLNGTSAEVNPMAPWDKELPKFVHLPEYGILPTVRDRQDAFNAWCKDRIREKRAAKISAGGAAKPAAAAAASASPSSSAAAPAAPSTSSGDALSAYRALLQSAVTSTRTRFEDFKKEHKRERPFFAYGRDDREREKEFRRHLRELGERKKRVAEEREEDFLRLLEEKAEGEGGRRGLQSKWDVRGRETPEVKIKDAWSHVKKIGGMERDKRYDAVGSSSRRAELFGLWITGQRSARPKGGEAEGNGAAAPSPSHGEEGKKERDAQRALREREEKVRKEMGRVQHQNARALGAATHGDSVIQYQQLLLDSVRDPLLTWSEARPKLSTSERFGQGSLSEAERASLFEAHLSKLVSQRRRAVRELFEKHAGARLDVDPDEACALVVDDEAWEARAVGRWIEQTAQRDDVDRSEVLRDEYQAWDQERKAKARADFDEMLKENSFLEFWGRLAAERRRKLDEEQGGKGEEKKEAKFGPGDDDDEMEQADLLQMASTIDLDEVHSVLRNDQRYRAWKHEPELREQWIRDHLERMEVPTLTVHQQMAGATAQ